MSTRADKLHKCVCACLHVLTKRICLSTRADNCVYACLHVLTKRICLSTRADKTYMAHGTSLAHAYSRRNIYRRAMWRNRLYVALDMLARNASCMAWLSRQGVSFILRFAVCADVHVSLYTLTDSDGHEDRVTALGRRVVSSTVNGNKRHLERFEKAERALSDRCDCKPRMRILYHGTSVANGQNIMASGFKIPRGPGGSAFGKGVNLTPDLEHSLMYTPRDGESCTLVCRVAIGKMHENTSRKAVGRQDTVPDFMRPKRGYDAMTGAAGKIIVVPAVSRVLPMRMIVHSRMTS
jgi:hypothetical protein